MDPRKHRIHLKSKLYKPRILIVLDNPNNIAVKKTLEKYTEKEKRIPLIINKENLGLVKS